jgi:hypothetical protein
MSKITRRLKNKKNKKNRTIKKGGSTIEGTTREGIFDIIGNKISNIASSTGKTIGDTGLKIIGLERIDKSVEEENSNKKIDDAAYGIVSDVGNVVDKTGTAIIENVGNVVDKTGAAIIENVNEVLGSDIVKQTTEQAAEQTADIVKDSAEKFNEALNDPEVKAELEEAIENAGEVGEIVLKAAKKPLDEAIDIAAESTQKASSAAVSGAIKVTTDALSAIPFWGAIIDLGKMVNDGSSAASAVVEAGSEAVEGASDAFIETKENVEKGLKELEEKKRMSEQISNRTINSINDYENPVMYQKAGTRRRLLKRKAKSKRVRFLI